MTYRRVRHHWATLFPAFAALAIAGCASSDLAGPGEGISLQLTPPQFLASFNGLVVEQIRAQVLRIDQTQETSEVILDRTTPFNVDRTTLNLSLSVALLARAETLGVQIDFQTAQGRILFQTFQNVIVTSGRAVNPGPLPTPVYLGPGNNTAALTVTPQRPSVIAGETLDFGVTAVDVQGAPVDTVYTSWRASGGKINALGHFTAPSAAGQVYVSAATPNGVRDSTLVTVLPVGAAQINGLVVDGETGAPLAGVTVHVVASNGDTVATAVTTQAGAYSTQAISPGTYLLVASLNGFVSTTVFNTDATGGVSTAPTIPLAPDTKAPGNITGGVSDATSGNLISNPTLELRAGINATTGTPLATTTGDVESVYFFNGFPPGTYTITASASGYVNASVTAIVLGNLTTNAPGIILSPVGSETARIVLTWGAMPSDLDAHLTGPDTVPGLPRFHVYYANPGDLTARPYAALDIDNTSSFGPETITITKQFSGVYRYSVHDFSDSDLNPSSALAGSGARVQVYLNGALTKEFFVPNQAGTLWTVFELNGTTITPINAMSYEPNSDAVSIRAPGDGGSDAEVIGSAVRHHPKR
jgi:Carboxypeptidase regulatory-like domain